MRCRDLVMPLVVAACLAPAAAAQDSTRLAAQRAAEAARITEHTAQMRALIEQIARERPQQAEVAARDLLRRLQLEQIALDSLRRRSMADYWAEVAQLTVQRQMLEQQDDSARRALMGRMFGAEALARGLQRAYRETDDSTQVRSIRERLTTVLERHLMTEDSFRDLEVADIERRLAEVRAETVRRRRERADLVRRMVEEVLRDARRPD